MNSFIDRIISGVSAVSSSVSVKAIFDSYSGAMQTIETEHLHIHAGRGFQLSGDIASLASSLGVDFYIAPKSGQAIHLRNYRYSANGSPVTISLYESPTISVTGTQATPMNRNRKSSKVSSCGIFTAASATALGTHLATTRIEGTGATGETEGPAVEWVLDDAKTYLIRAINNDAGSVKLNYNLFWYELGL